MDGQFTRTNGTFFPLSALKMTDIKDGTTNTAMLGEINLSVDGSGASGAGNVVCGSPHDLRGRYHNSQHGNVTFTTLRAPNTPVGDLLQYCAGNRTAPCRGCVSGATETHARSNHPGGAHLGMGDGKVTFVSENIDQALFQGAGTVNGGEIGSIQ